jgi:hypothetical protein
MSHPKSICAKHGQLYSAGSQDSREAPSHSCCTPVGLLPSLLYLRCWPPVVSWPQVDALRPGLLGRRDEFASRYCGRRLVPVSTDAGRAGGRCRWNNSGGIRLHELHGLLRRQVSTRYATSARLHRWPHITPNPHQWAVQSLPCCFCLVSISINSQLQAAPIHHI